MLIAAKTLDAEGHLASFAPLGNADSVAETQMLFELIFREIIRVARASVFGSFEESLPTVNGFHVNLKNLFVVIRFATNWTWKSTRFGLGQGAMFVLVMMTQTIRGFECLLTSVATMHIGRRRLRLFTSDLNFDIIHAQMALTRVAKPFVVFHLILRFETIISTQVASLSSGSGFAFS